MAAEIILKFNKTFLPNTNRCENVREVKPKNTMLRLEMVPGNVCSTPSAGEIRHHTFFLMKTKNLVRLKRQLPRDNQVTFRTRVQGSVARHTMRTSFCHKIYGEFKNYVKL